MKLFLFSTLLVMVVIAEDPEPSSVLKNFADESIQYVGELYQELTKVHSNNFLVSPLSVKTVFALVNGGAKGNTSKQITTSLHLPNEEEKTKEIFLHLTESLQANSKYNLSSANKIYLANYFKINEQYKTHAADVFKSEIQNIDFKNAEESVTEINKWVENKTHDKIKNLLSEDTLDKDTLAVMINTLYFQGKWVKQFSETLKGNFSTNDKELFIDMMRIIDKFNYCNNSELKAQFLEMPYEGNDVTMTFVLPHEINGLPSLEARISDVLAASKYEVHNVNATIPKFTLETTIKFIPVLQALGINDAFSKGADFSGIVENQEELFISDVVQKAFIEIDEKGTSATAATVIDLINRVGAPSLTFAANHPFMFYLKHKINGILFIGRYSVPEHVY